MAKLLRRRSGRDREAAMTVMRHLTELRNRLIWVVLAVVLSAGAGWALYDAAVRFLLRPALPFLKGPAEGKLIFTSPLEAFTLRLKISLYIGVVIAFPVILYQVWRFIAPGLKGKEKRYAIPFVLSGIVLFGAGIFFAYITLPQALLFLIGKPITGESLVPLLTAAQYLNFMTLYLFAFGLTFQFPVVLMFLSLLRVVNSRQMKKYRRHVFMGIALVVAFATPSVDFITMGGLTAALYILFEACILLSRILKR